MSLEKGPDFPSDEQMRAWGDVMFLAMRCPRHRGLNAMQLRQAFEPAVMTGKFRIFRFDGVPRAMLAYAHFSYDAEQKYLSGEPLTARDWQSGRQLWIVDFMAPYAGLTAAVSRWVMTPGNLTKRNFYFRRVAGEKTTRRIVHVDFESTEKLGAVLSLKDFGIAA